MTEELRECPACGSKLRVSLGVEVEVVAYSKPRPEERWIPPAERGISNAATPVVNRIAFEAGVSIEELRGPSRSPSLVEVRRQAAAAARTETEASLPEIGRALGRDHSTVMHYLEEGGRAR